MLSAKKELFTPSGGGYQISRSVRLRSSASAYFTRTPSVAGNRRTFTISAWVKKGRVDDTAAGVQASSLFGAGNTGNVAGFKFAMGDVVQGTNTQIFSSQETIHNVSNQFVWYGTERYRDSSAWYHVVVAFDTPQATASNRLKIWVNGQQIGAGNYTVALAQNQDLSWNNTVPQFIGASTTNSAPWLTYFDGLLAEVYSVDGQALTPSSFGETNAITGVWQPKRYAGTYGTNGFYLNFSDNSNNTATTIGKDNSGNGNNWTPNNISVTAGTTYDSMIDVPTLYADGDKGRGNYSVMNPLAQEVAGVVIDGNLRLNNTAASNGNSRSTIAFPSSGLWYVEGTVGSTTSASVAIGFGVILASVPVAGGLSGYNTANTWSIYASNISNLNNNGSVVGSGGVFTAGDVLQVAVDRNNNRVWVGKNNTWYNSTYGTTGDPSTGANPTFTSVTTNDITLFAMAFANSFAINFGQRPFAYTPPTGFKALNTQNLPDATIKKGNLFFNTATWSSDIVNPTIGQKSIALGFQPDLVWSKNRDNAESHYWMDSVRGDNAGNKWLRSNATAAEGADALGSTTASYVFNSTGFDIVDTNSASGEVYFNNGSASTPRTYVGWAWNAGGSTVTNTSGTISSQVRANPTAGFSVVTYTGTGANATVGHGLGVAPSMIIVKSRNTAATNWVTYHTSLGATKYILLNTTGAVVTDSTPWNNTAPTSSVLSLGTSSNTNGSTATFVAYCFAAVAGYSAFGSYTGNGSADGPFVYCGFRPRWVMVKRTDSAGYGWIALDTARNTYNVVDLNLNPNDSVAEFTTTTLDILSNGFKLRTTDLGRNASGGTYVYASFAENPFKNSLAR